MWLDERTKTNHKYGKITDGKKKQATQSGRGEENGVIISRNVGDRQEGGGSLVP
jgi:hypothetical protein